jgi:AcrR family transcriptional regulator
MSEAGTSGSGTKPNRTDRRRERTRQQLMAATIALILKKGVEETATDEITDAADVGRRTFYNHFDNKQDCIKAAIGERFSRYAAESFLIAEKHEDPAVALTVSAMAVFTQVSADPVTAQLVKFPRLLIETIRESQREFIMHTTLQGLEKQRFSTSIPPEALDALVSWGFVGLVLENITQPGTTDRSTVWAHFILQNLGIEQEEIETIINTARGISPTA